MPRFSSTGPQDSILNKTAPTLLISGQFMKTFSAKPEEVRRDWFVVDATDKILGRLATELASRLRGKHKAVFTPHVDTGDHIVVVNAARIRVTGNKMANKIYYHHTGYIGNLKSITLEKLMEKAPEEALIRAVKGMLPKNPLGRAMMRKLRVFAGPEHEHQAQQPQPLDI
jgi:large subunit ribosomal protein L13